MQQFFIVGIGSFLGGGLRYLISVFFNQKINPDFPYATLSVNLLGCLLIGVFYGLFEKSLINNDWKLFLTTGLCGGFTTFSALSHEALQLFKQGNIMAMLFYILISIIIGITLTYAGYLMAKSS
jgi:CrcB protein